MKFHRGLGPGGLGASTEEASDPPRIDQDEASELGRLVRASRGRRLSARATTRMAERLAPARASAIAATSASSDVSFYGGIGGAKAGVTALVLLALGGAIFGLQTWKAEHAVAPASAAATPAIAEVPPSPAPSPTVETPSIPVEALPLSATPAVASSAVTRISGPRPSSSWRSAAPVVTPKEEFALIKRAEDALSPSPSRALAIVEEHARTFPAGELVQEREMVAVEALMRLGRKTEAKRRADALLERFPRTPYVARLERALGEPLSPTPPATTGH